MALGERLLRFIAWRVPHICLVLLCQISKKAQNSPGDGFLKVHRLIQVQSR